MTATPILWQPTPSEIKKSELSNFANWVKSHHGFDWRDKYRNLWSWSVEYPDLFWDSIWQWHGVIGRKGKRLLINRDKIPGAQFFPDSTLNFAENLLLMLMVRLRYLVIMRMVLLKLLLEKN